MLLQHIGLSKSDLQMIETQLAVYADTLEDVNGAAPPKTVGDPPAVNQDFLDYIQAHRIINACSMMRSQVEAYDTANTSDTNPAARVEVQAGGY